MSETAQMSDPEFSFHRLRIRGKEAIRSAGWTLRVLVLAQATALLVVSFSLAAAALRWL
jgi:hypothetical protein